MSQNNSIEFQAAMENFAVMFPQMDSDVIEEILRINRGSVERTIDQLLAIAGDNQNDETPSTMTDANAHKASVNSLVNLEPKLGKSRGKWNPVLLKDLDPNFLRITHDQEYCDEFAVMLQNEEFLAELRFNQEFLSTLDKEQGRVDSPLEERLKNMGKISRKKFHQLARIFTFQRKKTSQKPKSKLLEDADDEEAKGSKK